MRYYTQKLIFIFCCFLFLTPVAVFAQYKGQPVQKERLIQVLRSKQFQSRDIVQIVNENGVDFKLSPVTENQLVSAGARSAVLDAVRRNYRGGGSSASIGGSGRTRGGGKTNRDGDYAALLNDAINAYDYQKNTPVAMGLLEQAVSLQPSNPQAYQMLGYVNLYGKRDFDAAESYWKKSINLGGNAVLRVIHDHDGSFVTSCQGSLYISKNIVRFESDNNVHTFETTDRNIKKIEVNNKWRRLVQLKGGSFKILLNKDDGETKYNFAPLSGKTDESKIIIRLIGK